VRTVRSELVCQTVKGSYVVRLRGASVLITQCEACWSTMRSPGLASSGHSATRTGDAGADDETWKCEGEANASQQAVLCPHMFGIDGVLRLVRNDQLACERNSNPT
jgi:hypothetical protein